MIPYQKQKFDNAICYFATEHSKRTEKLTTQTYIYKYLALLDFKVLRETGKPALNIGYDAYLKGPVPHIYNRRHKHSTELYEFAASVEDKSIIYVVPKKAPNLDYFSEYEVEIMNQLIDEFARKGTTTDPMIRATHKRIRAWREAWKKRGIWRKAPMRYEDTFTNLDKKSEDQYSIQEENFMIFKGLDEAPT